MVESANVGVAHGLARLRFLKAVEGVPVRARVV